MLEGKRLLITGVLTEDSIAFHVAQGAQRSGAEVVLTGFGRGDAHHAAHREAAAERADVLELDVNEPEQLEAAREGTRRALGPRSTASCTRSPSRPPDALGGNFLTHAERVSRARVQDQRLLPQGAVRQLCCRSWRSRVRSLRRRPRLRRHGRVAGLRLDGRREGRARGGAPLPRQRPRPEERPLQPRRRRADPDGRGEAASRASSSSPTPGSARLRSAGTRATRRRSPTPACWLLSEQARAITGEILHVDGGYHALGAPASDGVVQEAGGRE